MIKILPENMIKSFSKVELEASFTRVPQHTRNRNIGMILASRDDLTAEENRRRHAALKSDVRKARYGFIEGRPHRQSRCCVSVAWRSALGYLELAGAAAIDASCRVADFERDLIRERTGEGRKRAMAAGTKFGRPQKLSDYQRQASHQAPGVGGHLQKLRGLDCDDLAAVDCATLRPTGYRRRTNLILLDTKFPRQIFYLAKLVFPFSNHDAVFTSRFFRKYHELSH
jgi:hypothetical protein